MSEVQKTQPPLPEGSSVRPSQLVLIEAAEVVSLWQRLRVDDEHLAPKNAWKLMALWAHLRRFPEENVNAPTKTTIDQVVEAGKKRLIAQMLRYSADGWLEQANELNSAGDWVHSEPDLQDLACHSWQLFNELDRFSLATYAANRWLREDPCLLADDDSSNTALEDLNRFVKEGEDYVRENADVFFPAASLASLCLLAYRPNLDEDDEALWLTTLKHRVLEELLEEANEPVPQARLIKNDLISIREAVQTDPDGGRAVKAPVLRTLKDTMNDLAEAFRRHSRAAEVMHATAAVSGEKKEAKVLWDFKQDLVRCIVYQEVDGDWRFDFSSTDDRHENQTFEVVVKEQTRPTITFRRDPESGELYGEARIHRDELPEAPLSQLTIRLKKT